VRNNDDYDKRVQRMLILCLAVLALGWVAIAVLLAGVFG
jgi:hypothetical protein